MADHKVYLNKLNNNNYSNWKFKMELLLTKEKSWKVIRDRRPVLNDAGTNAREIDDWDKLDCDARATIGLSIEDDQIIHVRSAKTAKEAWDSLKNYHEKSTLSNKVYLMRTICSMRAAEGANIADHINQMNELFVKLTDLGEDAPSDGWSVAMLMSSLPRTYDGLITALEARPEADLTFNLVQQKVIAEYERHTNASAGEKDSILKTVSNTLTKSRGSCFFCKSSEHFKQDCPKYKEWKKKKNNKQQQTVNKVNTVEERDVLFNVGTIKGGWILDSGATRHVVNDKKFFTSLNESYNGEIEVANGDVVKVIGIGTGKIKLIDSSNSIKSATVNEVLYAPSLVGNIISVRQLVKAGYEVNFSAHLCEIKHNGKQIAVADLLNDLYKLRESDKVNSAVKLHHKEHCIHHWHKIFGHRDPEAIKKMCADGLVDGLRINECDIRMSCDTCMKGKTTRLPFPSKSTSKTNKVVELIHTDVCGPMQTATSAGNRYFVTFIDDFSRFTVICLLKHKSEVSGKLKNFIEFVRNKFGRKPNIIRSDRGGEYTGSEIRQYLEKNGIQVQFTTPHTPQQNGVAERKNRTLMEMARCLLIDANLPNTFWGEAVATANYIQNRVLTRSTDRTPYELWEGVKPNVKHLQSFGSKCFVHTPKEERKKLDETASEMIFIGYDCHSKAYRCYDAEKKKVVVSRDVRFTVNSDGMSCKTTGSDIPLEVMIGQSKIESKQVIQEEQCNISQRTDETTTEEKRVSQRENKGIPPSRYTDGVMVLNDSIREPKSYNEAIGTKEKDKWINAMRDEMSSLLDNQTWEIVDLPADRTPVGCKWIFKIKKDEKNNIQRFKARLVAQGFSQKYGTDYDEVFAPVVRQTTFRTLLSVAAERKMQVNHMDAKTAFLNGELREEIYMKQPPGFIEDDSSKVCILKKSLYGLKQAARSWNEAIHQVIINSGFQQSTVDKCLYTRQIQGNWCYILIYVDDIVVAYHSKAEIKFIERALNKNFEIQDLGAIKLFLGIEVHRDGDGNFELCQSGYIGKIVTENGLENSKPAKTPMEVGYGKGESSLLINNNKYQQLIGSLLYLSINTRPDISASVSILAQKVSGPNEEDWNQLKRVVKYLKSTVNLRLKLSNIMSNSKQLIGYADANWAEDKESRKSNSGFVFFFNGGTISWACRKQSCVALSSTEAEFISLSEACQEAQWLRKLLQDLNHNIDIPTTINEDNQSCLKIIKEEKFSNRTKHIDTKFHFVKDYVDRKIVNCVYCPTDTMIADLLTKPLSFAKHSFFTEKCNLI